MFKHRDTANVLAGAYLSRVAHLRKDKRWLTTALVDDRSLFVPVWRSRNLIASEPSQAVLLQRQHPLFVALNLPLDLNTTIFLGQFRERACFAFPIDDAQEVALPDSVAFQELRTVIGNLARDEAGLLSYARAMVSWRSRHGFCSNCGSPTQAKQAGHVMTCTNSNCATQIFPRIDPAIIVLVTNGERALLGRQAAWPPGRYSTVAGFVEPGESLEDAVTREVFEETGVDVATVEYHSSQPWPFPSSLMLGFMAQARSTDIVTSDNELEDAKWFSREQIAAGECSLPPAISISGCLIEDWYNQNAAQPLHELLAARRWNVR